MSFFEVILAAAVIVIGASVPVSLIIFSKRLSDSLVIFAKKLEEMSGSADAVREVSATFIEVIRGQGEISQTEIEARLAQNHIVSTQTEAIKGLVNAVETLCRNSQEYYKVASAEHRAVLAEIKEMRRERNLGGAQRGLR